MQAGSYPAAITAKVCPDVPVPVHKSQGVNPTGPDLLLRARGAHPGDATGSEWRGSRQQLWQHSTGSGGSSQWRPAGACNATGHAQSLQHRARTLQRSGERLRTSMPPSPNACTCLSSFETRGLLRV